MGLLSSEIEMPLKLGEDSSFRKLRKAVVTLIAENKQSFTGRRQLLYFCRVGFGKSANRRSCDCYN